MNQLEQLRKLTVVVADTGDFASLKQYEPTDSTTNPSLILKASQDKQYAPLMEDAVQYGKKAANPKDALTSTLDKVFVNFGIEILKIVPGRVSTEVDARLSFDVKGSITKAKTLIAMYEKAGINRKRVLIKLASTWEGVLAATELEREGIHCNMTLLFSLAQAVACAEAKATLISPFVGRILDWYKKAENKDFSPQEDPGVHSVRTIYEYFKKFGHETQIMGASFRNKGEILELAGCDLLTIAPNLLEELKNSDDPVERKLDSKIAAQSKIEKLELTESKFRFLLNDEAMAVEKLAEGIRKFSADIVKLENELKKRL